MEYITIDLENYPRREHFLYFSSMDDPYVGVTADVDITDFLNACRRKGSPFFLSFLYCVGRAANRVPELRRRILEKSIVEFSHCDTSHTELRADGTYGYCQINTMQNFSDYLKEARAAQEKARSESALTDENPLPLLFISSLPWLTYTQLRQPTPRPADSNPRITWGKYQEKNGRSSLPVTLLANHALADGLHIAHFYSNLEEQVRCFEKEEL